MKIRKKNLLAIGGLSLMLAGAIVMTVAYNRDRSAFENVFGIADYSTDFIETFDSPQNWITCQTVDKEIRVKNNTDVDIVARVKLEEEWTSKDGVGLPLVSNGSGEKMALINLTDNSGWTLDGTYYYSQTLAPGATSTSVISGVTLNCDADLNVDKRYADADYKLTAKVQTIQADKAATEWHKYATVSVKSISEKILDLRPAENISPWSFKRASQKANLAEPESDYYIQIDNDSNTPVYLWLDVANSIAYWYSDADDVYMISNNNEGFANTYFVYIDDYEGFRDINTSRMTSMGNLFKYSKARSLNGLEKWDVSNVTNMHDLFWDGDYQDYNYITDISALSRWDVSNVEDMSYMFSNHPVTDISALGGWNVRSVKNYYYMFVNTYVNDSICSLADWPVRHDLTNGYGVFHTRNRSDKVDASCLDPWDIPYGKNHGWFNSNAFILPSWAD
ncbi:BsaA family SipW-dependent biofilm matrix protein [Candidatus Saccharibacteria bacterium]|nr:BsaA family SipW-dependent biofilm matrix protein [Candidatus Saccharibacteria bacterium]